MKLSNRMISVALIASALAAPCGLWATARAFGFQSVAFSNVGFAAARVTQLSTLLGTLQSLPPDVRDVELAKTDFKSLDDLHEQTQSAIKDMKLVYSKAAGATERVRIVVIIDGLALAFASLALLFAARALRSERQAQLERQA